MKNIRRATLGKQGEDEKMNRKATSAFLGALLVVIATSAVLAGSASAAPQWKFEGKALEGTETILGGAEESSMTVPGMTTTCENFLYNVAISNSGGAGKGSLGEVPLYNCSTDGVCEVEAINAEKLPWSTELTSVSGTNYVVIKGVHVGILYSGEECVLEGFLVEVEGSAGGSVNNSTESATFNAATLKATGTELTAFGEAIEWNGVFPTEAFQWHRNQALTAS
jgi:hypothetical protein